MTPVVNSNKAYYLVFSKIEFVVALVALVFPVSAHWLEGMAVDLSTKKLTLNRNHHRRKQLATTYIVDICAQK